MILIFLFSGFSQSVPFYFQDQNVVDDLASLYLPTSAYNRVQHHVLVSSEEEKALARSASD